MVQSSDLQTKPPQPMSGMMGEDLRARGINAIEEQVILPHDGWGVIVHFTNEHGTHWSYESAGCYRPTASREEALEEAAAHANSLIELWGPWPRPAAKSPSVVSLIPAGELWQECCVRGCRTEPVNLCCERCEQHCRCHADAQQRAELEAVAPGLQARVAEYDDQARRGFE